nr:uncharacterized protein LOC109398979 [Aedes albopictus]XP_019526974.2 uncharacterized protein LOC109398979 [Aedes albopictus]
MTMNDSSGAFANESSNDQFLQLPHEDFASYCRLCFSISQLEPLLGNGQEVNYQLLSIIELCTGIKLTARTDSPSSLCLQCRYMMDEFYNFRKQCQRLNRVYQRKKTEMNGVVSVSMGYHHEENARGDADVYKQQDVVPEVAPDPPTSMEQPDETCATVVAAEPSAFEASVDDDGNAVDPESFTVHELPDENEDDVEWIGVEETNSNDVEMNEQHSDTFSTMANDWFRCKLCSGMYQTFVQLAKHLREVHPEEARALRELVKESYYKVNVNELQTVKFENQVFVKCDLCDTLLASVLAVKRHRWRYHGLFNDCREIHCRVTGCRSFCMEKKALNRHREIIHGHQLAKPWKKRKLPVEATAAEGDASNGNADDDDDVVFISNDSVPATKDPLISDQ